MKIRNGFVSNSSSSSFIINFDYEMEDDQVLLDYIEENPDTKIIVAMPYRDAVFELTNKMKEWLLNNKELFLNRTGYTSHYFVGDMIEDPGIIDTKELTKRFILPNREMENYYLNKLREDEIGFLRDFLEI